MAKIKELPFVLSLSDLPLSKKELVFIDNLYKYGFDHLTEAFVEAGYPFKTKEIARAEAMQLLIKPEVRQAIQRLNESVLEPLRERLLYEIVTLYYKRATWKPKNIYNKDGTIKNLDEISDEDQMMIDGIQVDYRGKDASQKITTYQMANKEAALKFLYEWQKTGKKTDIPLPKDKISEVKSLLDKARNSINKKTTIKKTTEEVIIEDEDGKIEKVENESAISTETTEE